MNRPVVSSHVLGLVDEEAVAIRRVASCPSSLHVMQWRWFERGNIAGELYCRELLLATPSWGIEVFLNRRSDLTISDCPFIVIPGGTFSPPTVIGLLSSAVASYELRKCRSCMEWIRFALTNRCRPIYTPGCPLCFSTSRPCQVHCNGRPCPGHTQIVSFRSLFVLLFIFYFCSGHVRCCQCKGINPMIFVVLIFYLPEAQFSVKYGDN